MTETLLERIANNIPSLRRRFIRKQGQLAEQIWDVLDRNQWNQRDLANRAGMRDSYISRLLRGGGNPTLKTICAIEEALGEEILIAPKHHEFFAVLNDLMTFSVSSSETLTESISSFTSVEGAAELRYIPGNADSRDIVPRNAFVPVGTLSSDLTVQSTGSRQYGRTG